MRNGLFVGLLIVGASSLAAAETWNEGKGTTWDCAKDPSGTINTNDGTYTFKGACTSITVNGNNDKVIIDRAEKVAVNGNKNTVTITAVDALATNGNDNKVSAQKSLTRDKPRVSNLGSRNTLTIGAGAADKPAEKAEADKPADEPKADVATIDCAKNPAYSIPSGRGTYKFTGTCDKISLAGGENTLSIEAVKELAITGSSNVVEVGAADRISAVGAKNKITYKKGISGAKPKVSTIGTNNKIEQVK